LENCDSALNVSFNKITANRGYGIKLLGSNGTTAARNKVFNNMVSLSQGTGTALAQGIRLESNATYTTQNVDVYHNSIYVKCASATAGNVIFLEGTATALTSNINIKNNILTNVGIGYVYNAAASTIDASTCVFDRNNIYAAGANIGTWNGTIVPQNQKTWVSLTNMDSLSSFVPVNFIDTNNLRLTGASIGNFNLATDITSLSTVDIDGTIRSGSYFYKGAHEASVLSPVVQTDASVWRIDSPVTITATGSNSFAILLRNTGLLPLTSVEIGHSINGTFGGLFTWTGSLLQGKSTLITLPALTLATGTNIISVWTQNTNATTLDLNATNDTAKVTTITSDPLTGIYAVGPTLAFQNLTAVASALKTKLISGNVVFELAPTYTSTTETFPITFTAPTKTQPYTVTIRPALGATGLVTEGAPATTIHLIVLDSTVGVTFDGRPDGVGTTSEWTIRNKQTATTYGACIRLVNGAQFDTIRYLKLEGQGATTTMGHITFSTTTQLKGNSYNTIEHCLFRDRSDVSAAAPSVGIYSAGTATARNEYNTIIDNTISNFAGSSISLSATGNGDGWIIKNNHIYYNSSFTPIATLAQVGINILSGAGASGYTISGNFIGGTATNCLGTPWINSGANSFSGIVLSIDSQSYSFIQNNTVANITKTSTGAASFTGISLQKGRAKISNNIIGRASLSDNITSSGSSYVYGIEIQNDLGTADSIIINGNTVSYLVNSGTAVASRIKGISVNFTTDVTPLTKITNNTVHHLSTAGTATGYALDVATAFGIYAFPSAYRANSEISNNTVYTIECSNTTPISTLCAGIGTSNFSGALNGNKIYDIQNKSTATTGTSVAVAAGLYIRFASNFRAYNNMISLSGSGNSDSSQLNGILMAGTGGGTHNYTYNSIHIDNGTGLGIRSFAFHRGQNNAATASAHPIVLRNNIFYNTSSSSGNHYAIGIEDTAVIVAGVSDWNVYKTNNPSTVGLFGTLSYNMASWRTRTINDVNTKNISVNFFNPAAADLHITSTSIGDVNLAGQYLAQVTGDFDGDVRDLAKPYIGADENTAFPLPVTLVQFTATESNKNVLLNWATATENNSSHFEIERSTDGKIFEHFNTVKAKGKSGSMVNYRIWDDGAFAIKQTNTLYYRMKIIDLDGRFEYSNIAIVSINETKETAPLSVFPNPFTDKTYININATRTSDAKISVVDITGKMIIAYTETVVEGTSVLSLQQSESLKTGIYFVSIEMNGQKQVAKLVKQ
jgi:hypothetical protein